jgi:HlyD family secretion protein
MNYRISFLVLVILLAGCESEQSPLPLVGTLERDRLELVAEANERITDVLVTEGENVREDQLLMRLDQTFHAAQIRAADAAVERAAQRLAELIRGPREEQIREARARLAGARERLDISERELERMNRLIERELTSEADLDRARDNFENTSAQVEQLEAALDALLEGTTEEELAQAQAQVDEAEALRDLAAITASRLDIVAPRKGRIDALPYKLGERPPAGASVIIMLADTRPFARVYIPEPLRAQVTPGTQAQVRIDGIEDAFDAEVRYVSADATFTPYYSLTQRDRSRLAFLAEVALTDSAALDLPSGVPVEVDFPTLR